jgi:hypothetical protein
MLSTFLHMLRKVSIGVIVCVLSTWISLFISSWGTFGASTYVYSRIQSAFLSLVPSMLLLSCAVGIATHIAKMSNSMVFLVSIFGWIAGLVGLGTETQNQVLNGIQVTSTLRFVLYGTYSVITICFIYWAINRLIRLIRSQTNSKL